MPYLLQHGAITMSFSISGGHLGFSAVENFAQGRLSLGIYNG